MGFRMKEIKKFLEGESPTLSLNFIHLLHFALFLFWFNYFISTRLLHFNTIDAPMFLNLHICGKSIKMLYFVKRNLSRVRVIL